MTSHEYKLFAAAFFADIPLLTKVLSKNRDTTIKVPIPEGYTSPYMADYYIINASEIAAMNRDAMYRFRRGKGPVTCFIHPGYLDAIPERHQKFYPHVIYHNSIQMLGILKSYPGYRSLMDYRRMSSIINSYDPTDEEPWFSKTEMHELMQKGYRDIDLHLVNAGVNCDGKKVLQLLKSGANPYVATEPNTYLQSEILSYLSGDESFYFMNYRGYWNLQPKEVNWDGLVYRMLWDLVGYASSSKLFRLIRYKSKFPCSAKALP
jgi:hypothetical protein